MGKQTKELYNMLLAEIQAQRNQPPPVNAPAEYMKTRAMNAAKAMDTGDFRTLPSNSFFNFQRPAEQQQQRQLLTNAAQTGTFGMADNAGATQATALQSQYLKDKFARDTAQNWQDNIAGAAQTVNAELAGASDLEAQRLAFEENRKNSMINTINNLYQFKKGINQQASSGIWGGVIAAAGGAASGALTGMKK